MTIRTARHRRPRVGSGFRRAGLLVLITSLLPVAATTTAQASPTKVQAAAVVPSVLGSGALLAPGATMRTPNGQVLLTMQTDGDLVVKAQGDWVWSTRTAGHPGASAKMQTDGNLVLLDKTGKLIWRSGTQGHPGARLTISNTGLVQIINPAVIWTSAVTNSTLTAGSRLSPGWSLTSPNGLYNVIMQADGNLVARKGTTPIWASGTNNHPGATVIQQADGNLVVYSATGKPLWSSRTVGYANTYATIQNGGNFVVYSNVSAPLWWPTRGKGAALCNTTARNPAGTAITQWNPITLCVLTVLLQSTNNLSDVNLIIKYESGGDANAINRWDINAKEGHPSEGLIQVIAPTFNRFRSKQLSANLLNPAANLYAGLSYAIYTYGSIHNIPGLVSLRAGGRYKGYVATPDGFATTAG